MRIAIVNDTPMILESLKRIIISSSQHEIAWLAENGKIATEVCAHDTPDLILMDLIMPIMDGAEASKIIMQHSPCAILVVTSSVEGNASLVFNAMGSGALDAVNTPVLNPEHPDYSADNLLRKIGVIEKLIRPNITIPKQTETSSIKRTNKSKDAMLLAIGSSTGGPAALVTLLSALPSDFDAAIVIVQHIDQQFCLGLIEWIDEQIHLPVTMAKNGEAPMEGHVYVSAGDQHLTLDVNGKFTYSHEPVSYPYQPSVNEFFNSVATHWQGDAYGVLLTGMGKDGAVGLLAMKQKGYPTIAQDEESCAVYGMPKAAAKLNAAKYVLPLVDISSQLLKDIN